MAPAMAILSDQPDQLKNGTRDLFLSYNRRNRAVVMRVKELLRQRAIKTFFDRDDLTPGEPWQNELERAIGEVRAVTVFISGEGIGTWQRPEKELALDRQVQERKAGGHFPVIPVLLPGADEDKITGFLSLNTWIDLRGGLDGPAAVAALDALARAVTGELPTALMPAPEPLCPYRGLEPFHEDDAPLFFGRDKFADDLLQKVLAHPLVAVVGPSGSGKSSVVQAGLLPRLRREGWPNKTWEALIFTPGEQPFHSLAKELLPLYETAKSKTEQMIEARKLGEALVEVKLHLQDPIDEALKTVQTANRLLLVIDQFEELFTLSEERYRQPFIESLIAVATRADSPVAIVLTLRADFYGRAIDLSRDLSDSIQQGLVNLGPMTRGELQQAIVEPARRVGLNFEPGLVARLLDDVTGRPGGLPLLQFALTGLGQPRDGRAITNEQYDAIGTLEGAISQRADEQFKHVPLVEREAMLRAFTRLVRVSAANEEGADTRQRVRLKDLDAAVYPVVKSFVKNRLLVMSRDEETNEEMIEVAHEALIQRWDRLKELLNKDRDFILWRQHLGLLLNEWKRLDRDAGALIRGAHLAEAKRWAKDRERDLNEAEKGFISRSEMAAGRPRRWAIAAAAAVLLVIASVGGWILWIRSNAYQIGVVLSEAPGLMASSDKESVRIDWVRALALAGRINESLATRDAITSIDTRSKASIAVAEALALVGQTDRALDVANRIEDSQIQSPAFVAVVEAIGKRGKVDEALAVARKVSDPQTQHLALATVVQSWIEAEKPDEALAVTREIRDVNRRSQALITVAEALAQFGKTDEALTVAREIKETTRNEPSSDHVQACIAVAGALAQAGKMEGANWSLNEAIASAAEIYNLESRSSALANTAVALMKVGRKEEAIRAAVEAFATARKIGEARLSQCRVFVSVAEALMKVGRVDQAKQAANTALTVAREIKPGRELKNEPQTQIQQDPYLQAKALALVAATEALNKAVRKEEAKQAANEARVVARQIENSYFRSETMKAVMAALIELQKTDEALIAACEISGGDIKSQPLNTFIELLAKISGSGMARQDAQFQALISTADSLIREGKMDEARGKAVVAFDAALVYAADDVRSRNLAGVAKVFAQLRSFRQARESAISCPFSNDRLDAYTTILLEYAKEQDPSLAKLLEAPRRKKAGVN